jgi:hypothetical protein
MATVTDYRTTATQEWEHRSEASYERWAHWPVNWSAVGVGALAAVAVAIVLGLIGVAIGFQMIRPERIVDLKTIKLTTLAFSIGAAFFSFVVGGWVAAKIAGILRAEPAMLHGAIVWLLAVPILVAYATFGASSFSGAWIGGLVGAPTWTATDPANLPAPNVSSRLLAADTRVDSALPPTATELQARDDTARAARNSALGAVTGLLLGLVGSVIGGWMASGEPMSFTYYRLAKHPR